MSTKWTPADTADAERVKAIYEAELYDGENLRTHDYTSWDDVIEFGELTYEEWEWCIENLEITVDITVSIKGGGS